MKFAYKSYNVVYQTLIIILYPSFENPNGSLHKNHQAGREITIFKGSVNNFNTVILPACKYNNK